MSLIWSGHSIRSQEKNIFSIRFNSQYNIPPISIMFPRSKQWLLLTIPFIPGKHTRPKTASRSPSWVVTIQHGCLWESLYWQLRVSINGGTTKSSIYRWIFQEINHPFGDTSIYIIYENPQLTPMRRFCMSMLYCLHGVLSRLPHTILQLLDLPCLLGMYSHVVLLVKKYVVRIC